MPLLGTLPLTASGSSKAGSVVMLAVPLTRKVSLIPGTGEKITDRVDPVVAEPVGDQEGLVVDDLDEAGRIALWRGVAAPRRVARGNDEERRQRDKGARMLFEPRQLLLDRALHRLAIDFADLGDVFDNVHPRLL